MKHYYLIILFFLIIFSIAQGCNTTPSFEQYKATISEAKSHPFFGIIYGDTRDKSWLEFWRSDSTQERQQVATRIAMEKPDFIIHTGDIVFDGSSNTDWEQFDRENIGIRRNGIPFFPCLGNHDYLGEESQALHNYFTRFPNLLARKWYDFTHTNVMFVILDTNYKKLRQYELDAQERWLALKLRQASSDRTIDMVIVVTHYPPYTNAGDYEKSVWVQEHFIPIVQQCSKVRLFVSGHRHTYEHFLENGIHFLVTGGGGAPLYSIQRDEMRHRDLFPGTDMRAFHYCKFMFHPKYVDVAINMRSLDGRWEEKEKFRVDYLPDQQELPRS